MLTLEEMTLAIDGAKARIKNEKRKRRTSKKLKEGSTTLAEESVSEASADKLQDKTDRVLEENIEEVHSSMMDNWKPYPLEEFDLPEFKITVANSNNSPIATREKLSRVLTFIEYAQRKRFKGGCTVMPIPTTSRQNLMIWGYPMKISRATKFMEDMGLITVYNGTYRFSVPYEGGNYGILYAYYEANEQKVIQYCRDNGIHKYIVKNIEEITDSKQLEKIEDSIEYIGEVRTFEISDVRFGKGLSLEKPKGVSESKFILYLTCCLYLNYPELGFHQQKADEINERFYENYPEFKLRFRPHFTWKGNKVVKIGIRLSNEFCNKEKEERKELLMKYGFHLEKDVRSSVPRLTLSINEGHWIDEDIDIYELINAEFEPCSECTSERRDNIKKYVLPIYFEDGSDKMLGKNLTYKLGKTGLDKKEVDELLGRLRKAMIKAVGGKTYGSDIFYIESCVYLMTLYDLLTSGHMVWLVYDAFYSNGEEDQELFETMVRNAVRLNFGFFMEHSDFKQFSKVGAVVDEKTVSVKDILNKYNIDILVNE